MKTCLICQTREPVARTSDPDVDILCSKCLLALTQATREEINKKYIEAVAKKNYGVAHALYTFTSPAVRKKHPLKKRR